MCKWLPRSYWERAYLGFSPYNTVLGKVNVTCLEEEIGT